MKKKILYGLLILLVVIQFFRPEKNQSNAVSDNDISRKYAIPSEVGQILKTSCYDCHSNNSNYPWYTNIQPVGWWMQNHVNEGKEELNFSEFLTYAPKKAHHKMEEVSEQVKEGEMPLSSYTLVHRDAILTAEQSQALVQWADAIRNEIKTAYNLPDEPERKKPE